MRRLFPILASIVGLVVVVVDVSGLLGRPGDRGRLARFATAGATLVVHGSAFVYLQATGRRVEAAAERSRLPGWVGAQAEKNQRKALIYEVPGSAMAVVAACLVVDDWWRPVLSGSSLSFQIGGFLGESLIVANQSRLVEHVGSLASPNSLASKP